MDRSIRLIHIAPELPPTVGGVADYTTILSRRLVEVSAGAVKPVLVHANKESTEDIEGDFPVFDLSGQCSATELAETVQRLADEVKGRAVVLLEYSGYGYAKRGAPLWLVRGLRRACGDDGMPLVTVFHEISASGPIWRSSFWLTPVHRWVAKQLVQLSERVFVNRPSGVKQLQQWTPRPSTVVFQPVFSNVGEPDTRTPLDHRDRYAVVFCGKQEKDMLYSRSESLSRVLDAGQVDRLVDIGPRPEHIPDLTIRHKIKGIQSAKQVSRWLAGARLGFAHRRLDLLTKSGVVAAYLAHGVPPVVLPNGSAEHTPVLSRGTHYTTLEQAGTKSIDWENLSRQGYTWYREQARSQKVAREILRTIDANVFSG
ncbi:hypothetical protein BSZ35_11095 [Salinibacter sp. 10B]|uniref:hypothetical protein n=1 Tax=Salinibacter sp. 10B TaxID=1923971 RepID=UPI000CF414CE|nr:hypothetical protein [Salinibacter sp. 10B]PQJ35067.1 hypothetical protein BSZ35_11095 [Salinibacter sp. 10B]